MKIETTYTLIAIAVGLGATLFMDLWGIFLKRVFKIPLPNYCLVGRWLCYMPKGIFQHSSIVAAAPMSAECALGWIAHYVIGVIYALALVFLLSVRWLEDPTLLPAMLLGIATVAFPFLVMQPSFGLGIASAKTPNPAQSRTRSLMNHAAFGFGLYIFALIFSIASKFYA